MKTIIELILIIITFNYGIAVLSHVIEKEFSVNYTFKFMKAKHFTKKIRKNSQYWFVMRSRGMFGDFEDYWNGQYYIIILARTAKRYMKRTHAIQDLSNWDGSPDQTNEMFAKLKVMPVAKPYQRFITYWK